MPASGVTDTLFPTGPSVGFFVYLASTGLLVYQYFWFSEGRSSRTPSLGYMCFALARVICRFSHVNSILATASGMDQAEFVNSSFPTGQSFLFNKNPSSWRKLSKPVASALVTHPLVIRWILPATTFAHRMPEEICFLSVRL